MKRTRSTFSVVIVAAAVVSTLGAFDPAPAAENNHAAFTLVPDEYGMVLKTPDGRTVFRYMTKRPAPTELTANSVCCLFPVNTPSGERMVDFAPSDHRHHRGVFMTWHTMHGKQAADFWGWGQFAPTKDRVIQNRSVKLVKADAEHAELAVDNVWTAESEVLIEEALSHRGPGGEGGLRDRPRLPPHPHERRRRSSSRPSAACASRPARRARRLTAIRRAKSSSPARITSSPRPIGRTPTWYDYTIALTGGKTVGIAVLDHPGNPPTAWHNLARDRHAQPVHRRRGPGDDQAGPAAAAPLPAGGPRRGRARGAPGGAR